jgi:hypothetical protein
MTSNVTSPGVGATTASAVPSETSARRTQMLLACGAVAGPLFIVVGVTHGLVRPGFDPVKHPLSLLSVGDLGWIQIANFVIAGLLFVGCGVGMRRLLHPGRAGTWGPWLYGAFGVSLIVGGVFVSDPGLGFPPGTPEGVPAEMSWHAAVHAVAPVVGFLALSLACFVFARRSYGLREPGWATFSVIVGIVIQALGAVSSATLNFIPLWSAMVLGFGWASLQAARLMAGRPRA